MKKKYSDEETAHLSEKDKLKLSILQKMWQEPNKLTNGLISIGYDISEDYEHCCLVVGIIRKDGSIMIINEFYDETADKLFEELVGKRVIKCLEE